jgi:uncharacterized protein (UPF0335 family)
MVASYLIELVERFCKENQLDISKVYKKMSEVYQNTYGVNIIKQMEDNKKWDIAYYLEELGIVERYITILNGLKNMIKEGWSLELDNQE